MKQTSASATSASSCSTSARTAASSCGSTACPGIGTRSTTPRVTAPGKMRCSFSAAATAFGRPPDRQSSNSNKLWRTGFENATPPLSTSVMCRTPHASKVRATAQPSVPAPISKHRVADKRSTSSPGNRRQRMSFRFRSMACSACSRGSKHARRSTSRGPSCPCVSRSQPTATGASEPPAPGSAAARGGSTMSSTRLSCAFTRPASPRTDITRKLRHSQRTHAKASRLRNGQPGFVGRLHGSTIASATLPGRPANAAHASRLWVSTAAPSSAGTKTSHANALCSACSCAQQALTMPSHAWAAYAACSCTTAEHVAATSSLSAGKANQ